MKAILLEEGVPEAAILCDHTSTSTYENLCNARDILAARGERVAIVVTDSIHAPRAILTARAIGLCAWSDVPSIKEMPLKTRLRRFRHELLAFPAYLARLPFWFWRARRP